MNDPVSSQGVSDSTPVAHRGLKPGTTLNLRPHDIITEGGAVGVLLSNRPTRVWVDQADFDSIVKTYGNRVWAWIELGRFVKLYTGPGSYVSVARLVVGPGGYFIRYADGDRLNLRRANLSTEEAARSCKKPRQKTLKQGLAHAARVRKALKAAPPQPVFAPQEKTVPAVEMPTASVPSSPLPANALFAKQSLPVVATVKRHSKTQV